MIRPLVAALLGAALMLPAPAQAGYQPVPFDPLPTAYDQLPLGPATTVPWWQAGVLHLGPTTLPTQLHELAARAGTTVIGSGWSRPGRRSTADLVRGTTLRRLPIAGHISGPEISADGHWIAWLDERESRISATVEQLHYRVVLYDAVTGKVVADHREDRRLNVEDEEHGLSLLSVANTGQVVFFRGYDHPYVLTPSRGPVRIKGRLPQLRDWDGWPLGITAYPGNRAPRFGTISPRGRFHQVGTTSTDYGVWSAAGDAFAFDLDGAFKTTHWVDHPASGTSVQLGLPADRDSLYVVGWEGPSTVLLFEGDESGYGEVFQFVRCDAANGACQRVDGGPVTGHSLAIPH